MAYTPGLVPGNEGLIRTLWEELERIADALQLLETDGVHFHSLSNAPNKNIDSIVIHAEADIVGPDKGLYRYCTTQGWVYVGIPTTRREKIIVAYGAALGASAPTKALRPIGASGGVKCAVLQFSKITQQDIYFEIHVPAAAMPVATDAEIHLMWIPGAGWTSGNYVWKVEYLVKAEDSDSTIGTPTTISEDVTPDNADDFIETEFSTKVLDTVAEDIVHCHLYRDVASDNADDVGELMFIELLYTSNLSGEPVTWP